MLGNRFTLAATDAKRSPIGSIPLGMACPQRLGRPDLRWMGFIIGLALTIAVGQLDKILWKEGNNTIQEVGRSSASSPNGMWPP